MTMGWGGPFFGGPELFRPSFNINRKVKGMILVLYTSTLKFIN